jgi:hypothetical protein
MKYTELTFTELVNKIGSSRFFDLPKMLKEVLSRLSPQEPKYKVYTALLTQSGTDAPVATVLENNLGNITFSYEQNGWYNIVSEGLFTENKTFSVIQNTTQETFGYQTLKRIDNNLLKLNSIGITGETHNLFDSIIDNSSIEIRVYN